VKAAEDVIINALSPSAAALFSSQYQRGNGILNDICETIIKILTILFSGKDLLCSPAMALPLPSGCVFIAIHLQHIYLVLKKHLASILGTLSGSILSCRDMSCASPLY
jgi:hypothetical protein